VGSNYFTNSLYGTWDDIFYPNGVGAWMARIERAKMHEDLMTRLVNHFANLSWAMLMR